MKKLILCCAVGLMALGCAGRPSMFPNADKNLRKTSAQFAADAAKRHPYKVDAPRGGEAVARTQVDYTIDKISIVNLSEESWEDVEVWINRAYVVHLPVMEPQQLKKIDFQMLFDSQGNSFPTKNSAAMVKQVEIYRGGKMYDLPVKLTD